MKEVDPKTKEKTTRQMPLFVGEDTVKGEVEIRLNATKKLEHMGIKIELVGQIGKLGFIRCHKREGSVEQFHVLGKRPRAFWNIIR
jgi:hypothetical protein